MADDAQRSRAQRTALIALGGLAAAIVVVLLLAQLVLPGISEDRLRSRLDRHGTVERVEVSAFPAIKLLWGEADRVEVELATASAPRGKVGDLISEAQGVAELEARVGVLRTGALTLHEVTLRKDGDALVGSARIADEEVRTAFPIGVQVADVAPVEQGLRVRVTADLPFLPDLELPLLVLARGGAIEVEPEIAIGPRIVRSLAQDAAGRLLSSTVFDDQRIDVTALTARPAIEGGFVVTARGRLR